MLHHWNASGDGYTLLPKTYDGDSGSAQAGAAVPQGTYPAYAVYLARRRRRCLAAVQESSGARAGLFSAGTVSMEQISESANSRKSSTERGPGEGSRRSSESHGMGEARDE